MSSRGPAGRPCRPCPACRGSWGRTRHRRLSGARFALPGRGHRRADRPLRAGKVAELGPRQVGTTMGTDEVGTAPKCAAASERAPGRGARGRSCQQLALRSVPGGAHAHGPASRLRKSASQGATRAQPPAGATRAQPPAAGAGRGRALRKRGFGLPGERGRSGRGYSPHGRGLRGGHRTVWCGVGVEASPEGAGRGWDRATPS